MPNFRTASRTQEEMVAAKLELDNQFSVVRNKDNTVNKAGIKQLEENKWELAELVLQLINDEVSVTDPLPFLVDTVSGEFQNKYIWQEINSDARVVQRAYGSKPLSQRVTFKEFPITTYNREVVMEVPLEEVASGRVTPSLLAQVIADTINRYRVANTLNALDAGVPSGADRSGIGGYTLRYTGGVTQSNLDKAVDGLTDEGEAPVIFGRHVFLAPAIRGFTGWGDLEKSEMNTRGLIGTYNGADVIALRDKYSRRAGSHVFRNDRVYLASGTKGAIYMEKDVSFLNFVEVDARTDTFAIGTRIEDGLLVWDPYQYRIITT